MTRRSRFPRLGQSIFAKLLAIMMVTALTLLVLVTGFFAIVVFPTTTMVTQSVVREYARMLAAASPDLGTAQDLQKRIYVKMRYEGPRGSWTTDESLPTIAQARQGGVYATSGIHYHIEPAPDGGAYLLSWNVSELTRAAHVKLLWLLSFLMLGVVFTAYYFQKKLLQPLRSLSDGVVRVGANDLNVVLPITTHDEFGALTESFNNMVRRVREMIVARDQLLLDVSHELRSPLTRMKVALALSTDEEMKSGMTRDLNEMEVMITELLELERLRDGKGIRREYQDIVSILREIVRTYENRAPGIRFSTSPASLLLDVDGDKIRTVFRNVLENAIKYSLPDSGPIEVVAEQDDHGVAVRISDDGPGIPEQDIPNVFEPFFRVDRSRSRKTGGFGLGLSICKRVMAAHGGTVAVENNPGRGALFVLNFPITKTDVLDQETKASIIVHITRSDAWQASISSGYYRAPSLQSEGFIHCSTIAQVTDTANAFFRGQRDLVLLCIDVRKLEARLKYEPPAGGTIHDAKVDMRFPHLYGPLNLSAVNRVVELSPDAGGSFVLPPKVQQMTAE